MRVTKNFYWCIYYQVTGYPKPNRTWYFNNQLLQNPHIKDLENAWTMKNAFLADGNEMFSYLMYLTVNPAIHSVAI